jgi:hypothetical protein
MKTKFSRKERGKMALAFQFRVQGEESRILEGPLTREELVKIGLHSQLLTSENNALLLHLSVLSGIEQWKLANYLLADTLYWWLNEQKRFLKRLGAEGSSSFPERDSAQAALGLILQTLQELSAAACP